jgi:hypothetical protein
MEFYLTSPDLIISESNVLLVKAMLTNGAVEILESHQDLIGKIDVDCVEFEIMKDNIRQNSRFLLQDGLFFVSNKRVILGLSSPGHLSYPGSQEKEKCVTVYARRALNISRENYSLTLERARKEYLEKTILLEKEEKQDGKKKKESTILLLRRDLVFLQKVIFVITNVQ